MINRWALAILSSIILLGAMLLPTSTSSVIPQPEASPVATPASCPVTQSNGYVRPPDVEEFFGESDFRAGYGNAALWTNLWMWGEYVVPVPDSHVQPDGSLGPMKWAWYRFIQGDLTIEGRRLDGEAPPLRGSIPGGYGDIGFQPVGIIFPTGGCWEITGRVDGQALTFVVNVVPPPTPGTPVATPGD